MLAVGYREVYSQGEALLYVYLIPFTEACSKGNTLKNTHTHTRIYKLLRQHCFKVSYVKNLYKPETIIKVADSTLLKFEFSKFCQAYLQV